jgi:hypothetical protein
MTDRMRCEVIGCNRTRKRDAPYSEWLCPKHWPLVPKYMKRVLFRVHRRARRYGYNRVIVEAERRVWRRCVRAAIETSVGL